MFFSKKGEERIRPVSLDCKSCKSNIQLPLTPQIYKYFLKSKQKVKKNKLC